MSPAKRFTWCVCVCYCLFVSCTVALAFARLLAACRPTTIITITIMPAIAMRDNCTTLGTASEQRARLSLLFLFLLYGLQIICGLRRRTDKEHTKITTKTSCNEVVLAGRNRVGWDKVVILDVIRYDAFVTVRAGFGEGETGNGIGS